MRIRDLQPFSAGGEAKVYLLKPEQQRFGADIVRVQTHDLLDRLLVGIQPNEAVRRAAAIELTNALVPEITTPEMVFAESRSVFLGRSHWIYSKKAETLPGHAEFAKHFAQKHKKIFSSRVDSCQDCQPHLQQHDKHGLSFKLQEISFAARTRGINLYLAGEDDPTDYCRTVEDKLLVFEAKIEPKKVDDWLAVNPQNPQQERVSRLLTLFRDPPQSFDFRTLRTS